LINVGITGHQVIGDNATIAWVQAKLIEQLSVYHAGYGYTSLAVGADQLFAEILLARSLRYQAVIPARDYKKTFVSQQDIEHYEYLLEKADTKIILPYEHSSEEAFFAAGKKVVELSDIVFAIWNGKPAKGLGGTADVVKFAQHRKKKVIQFNNDSLKLVVL